MHVHCLCLVACVLCVAGPRVRKAVWFWSLLVAQFEEAARALNMQGGRGPLSFQ